MSVAGQTITALNVILLLQLAALAFVVQVDPYIRREHRRILLTATLLVLTLLLQNQVRAEQWAAFWHSRERTDFLLTLLTIYGYCVRPIVLALLMRILSADRRPWFLVGANLLIHLSALFSDAVFRIEDGVFLRGPLGYTCHVTGFLLLVWDLRVSLGRYRNLRKREAAIPVVIALLLMAATICDTWFLTEYRVSLLVAVTVGGCVFYYIWLHLQFVREHEQALIAEQRIRIMMSQIQPHFLYNTLATIQDMCYTEPELAAGTISKFGRYLRENIDALSKPDLIPVEQELGHTRLYTDIEMYRFGKLRVTYRTEDEGFLIPVLTIQPLVENAIRHGVRTRDPGVVTVTTRREADCHVVRIEDNGVGFDASSVDALDESHVGIRNVRDRLERLCGGTLTIDSRIGEGTTAVIRIPVSEEATA